MRTIIVALLILFTIFAGTVAGNEFKITKVIEVNSGPGRPRSVPKWSPDGTRLAFFRDSTICISDTLGNTQRMTRFATPPRYYEWLTTNELVMGIHVNMTPRTRADSILIVDIQTNQKTVVDTYDGPTHPEPAGDSWPNDGPWLTIEGNVYYRAHINPWKNSESQGKVKLLQGKHGENNDSAFAVENHFFSWESGGLYKISCDLLDSIRLAPRPSVHILLLPKVSPNGLYYMEGGTIYRLSDSTYFVLDTMLGTLPNKTTQCSFFNCCFNPMFPEVAFQIICEGYEGNEGYEGYREYEDSRVGIYNFDSGALTILDTLIGIEQCELAVYNPDGRKLALYSRGKLYVVYREKTDE